MAIESVQITAENGFNAETETTDWAQDTEQIQTKHNTEILVSHHMAKLYKYILSSLLHIENFQNVTQKQWTQSKYENDVGIS
jgi:hypothetical protein